MKKSLTTRKTDDQVSRSPAFSRQSVIKAFQRLGYLDDFNSVHITVLRNTTFPFQRITVPNTPNISIELLRCYAEDLRLDLSTFVRRIESLSK